MKYPFRYLFALVAIVAMLLQGGRDLWELSAVASLEIERHQLRIKQQRLIAGRERSEAHSKLCRQMNDLYQYPGNLAAAEKRSEQLRVREAGR